MSPKETLFYSYLAQVTKALNNQGLNLELKLTAPEPDLRQIYLINHDLKLAAYYVIPLVAIESIHNLPIVGNDIMTELLLIIKSQAVANNN